MRPSFSRPEALMRPLPVRIRPGMTRLGRFSPYTSDLDGRIFLAVLLVHALIIGIWIALQRPPKPKDVPFALADVQMLFEHGTASIDPIPAPPPLPDAAPPVDVPAPVADELVPWPGDTDPSMRPVPIRPTGSHEATLSGTHTVPSAQNGDGHAANSTLTHTQPRPVASARPALAESSPQGTTGHHISNARTTTGQNGNTFSTGGASCAAPPGTYPPLAIQNHEEGTVVAMFSVAKTGQIRDLRLIRGSGHPLLNESAMLFLSHLHCTRPPFAPFRVQMFVNYTLYKRGQGGSMTLDPYSSTSPERRSPDAGTLDNADSTPDVDAEDNADATAGLDQSAGGQGH